MAMHRAQTWAGVRRALVAAHDADPGYVTAHMDAETWIAVLRADGAPSDWYTCGACGAAWIAGDGDKCDICGQ